MFQKFCLTFIEHLLYYGFEQKFCATKTLAKSSILI